MTRAEYVFHEPLNHNRVKNYKVCAKKIARSLKQSGYSVEWKEQHVKHVKGIDKHRLIDWHHKVHVIRIIAEK